MRISQVAVVPLYSAKDFGNIHGRQNEHDIIKSYQQTLVENFEEDRIHFEVLGKEDPIFDNTLVLYLDAGWNTSPHLKKNGSSISYSNDASRDLAEHIRMYVSDWGKSNVDFSHRTISFEKDETLCNKPNTTAIKISPFLLNGPHSEVYIKNLPMLGKLIETCIFEFLQSRQWGPPKIGKVTYG